MNLTSRYLVQIHQMMVLWTMMASSHCLMTPMTPFIHPSYISLLYKFRQCPFTISGDLVTSIMAEIAKHKNIDVNHFIKLSYQR